MTQEQVAQLRAWLLANSEVSEVSQIGGYSLGSAYIDDRANGGKHIGARRKYVAIDKATARAVPEARGLSVSQVLDLLTQVARE